MALAAIIAAYFLQDPVEHAVWSPLQRLAGLSLFSHGQMSLLNYGGLMVFRLIWNGLLVAAIWMLLGRPYDGFPLKDRTVSRHFTIGLLIGLLVMVLAILSIAELGDATIFTSGQSSVSALVYGSGWLAFDAVGALGEELYGRAAILLVAERFVGWKGAIVISGLMFSLVHLGNPGASAIWLVRLAAQGALLAYAVYRTRSLWWSVGYHTGWNWASAPLFGAAGSGYLDEGHLFNFNPHGSAWITGGTVGPEGSVLAFLAVIMAMALLLIATKNRRTEASSFDKSRQSTCKPERPTIS
ncbi:MAG TPA: type II CAAX endopeptidase family protein [Dyella sp.]|nr:type II CAAX endopeptidase family protein [Dyella sp.]